nr:EAL domain-containing protein [Halomonas icarae]
MLEAQQAIHELIAQQASLETTLDAIAHWVGVQLPGAIVAFMRFDPARCTLSLLSSSRFSRPYFERLQNVPIGEGVASFGEAAYRRRQVITEDILTDPRWDRFRDAALAEGLRACWSSPVLSPDGELLGTFGIYYRDPIAPSGISQRRLQQAAVLIALAIIKERNSRQRRLLADRYQALFVNHPDGVYEFDLEGHFLQGNAALENITGYSMKELLGRHFNDFVSPGYRDLTQAAFDAVRSGASRHYETQAIHADGRHRYIEVTNFPVVVEGEIIGVYGICRDITEQKHQQAMLHLLQRGIEASPDGVLMADATRGDLPIVYANEAFCRLTGYKQDEVLGRNCRFLQGEQTDPDAIAILRKALQTQTRAQVTLLNYRKDGTTFWNRVSISPVIDESGHCTHFIGTQEDVTLERSQEKQIAYQATHDQLTGLPNRTLLGERLEQDYRWCQQQQCLLAVMYIDLDGFKPINEGLGYEIGNRLLVAIADRLRQLLGPHDTLSRLTSDEFAILLPNLATHEDVAERAECVLAAFGHSFEVDGLVLHISASIGVACSGEETRQSHDLLRNADRTVEIAKRQGRNTWQWFRQQRKQTTSEHILLRHDLYTALHENQLELYYQPIVDAVTGRIRSLEALVRWHHPEHGMISPGIFIPIAEQTGQIIPLGRWVLRQACEHLADMRAKGERVFPVAINISALQFHRDGFLSEVQAILEETGLPPELLELEMTESILMDDAERAVERINALRGMSIAIAIDDFGTGFSSLGYLRDLPIHKIKLDRSFIRDILTSANSAALVQGIITMAHHMGLLVVAEGVEEREQQETLIGWKSDMLQGYLFARPMPWSELRSLPGLLPAP